MPFLAPRIQWQLGLWKICSLVCSEFKFCKMAVVSNAPTFCRSLMVNIYRNCCYMVLRVAWPLRPRAVWLFFRVTWSYNENRGIHHSSLVPQVGIWGWVSGWGGVIINMLWQFRVVRNIILYQNVLYQECISQLYPIKNISIMYTATRPCIKFHIPVTS